MIYQNPQILYALLALAIPIIIHLFNFRKHEKVYFSSIRFLDEIKTQNKKKRNIKNLLILLSRIFALLFLILAFAKPYIPNENNSDEKNNIFIYIDNSFSMNAISEKGRLLDIAKNTANSIISSYPNTSNFHLLTNNFSSLNSRLLNKEKILEEISKVETNGSFKSFLMSVSLSQQPFFMFRLNFRNQNMIDIISMYLTIVFEKLVRFDWSNRLI